MTSGEIAADAQFVVNYFSLSIRSIAHEGLHSKGGISLAIYANPHTSLGKKCRRRWLNSEIRSKCLEQLIAKLARMICHNTGNCDIRILSGKNFI